MSAGENILKLDSGSIKGIPAQLACLKEHEDIVKSGDAEIIIVVSIRKPIGSNESSVAYSWFAQDDVQHKRAAVFAHLYQVGKIILMGEGD